MNKRYGITLFLFFITILVVKYSFAESWKKENVFTTEYFYVFYPRAIAVDFSGHPHIAYGGKHLYYTHHDGIAWQYETVDSSEQVGSYASIALDTSGKVHISYYDATAGDLKYATNKSGSWVIEVVDSEGGVGKDTALAIDASGKAHICYSDSTNKYLKYATNISGSWQKEVIKMAECLYPCIKVDKSNKVHINYRNSQDGVEYATNISNSWQNEIVDNVEGMYISSALDKADKVYISYAVNGALKYATNSSGAWVATSVDSIKDNISFTSLRIDKFGRLNIGYYDNNRNLKYATNNTQTGEWETTTVVSNNASGNVSLAFDLSGKAYISYQGLDDDINYATNASGTWVSETIVHGPYGIGGPSMAIDKSGVVHISGVDSKNNLVYFNNSSGSWTMQIVDNGNYSKAADFIAVDTSGHVHISYYDGKNGYLKYATNTSGTWAIQTVDSNGTVGRYNSLALDQSGHVHIAYYDDSNTHLKYATNMSGSWSTETVDKASYAGLYASIAVDAANHIHIAYFNDYYKARDVWYATNASGSWTLKWIDGYYYRAGYYTSLALDTSGNAHISYFEQKTQYLKYATNSSGSWVITAAGIKKDAGYYISIAVDKFGKAHISYYRQSYTYGQLKYATNVSGSWVHRVVDRGTPGRTSIALDPAGKVHIVYDNIKQAISESLDITPPTVSSTSPVNGATGVALDTSITATFSEAMNKKSINTNSFILKKGTVAVEGTLSYNNTTRKAVFKSMSPLDYWTTYTATITTGAKDLHKNSLASDYSWSFTTIQPPCIDPYEPNDNFESAYGPLTSGTNYEGKICSTTDKDFFKITVDKPGTIHIQMTVPKDKDYDLYLYDSAESEIASSRNDPGIKESIEYNVSETGTYYILVIGYADNYDETKTYTLTWDGTGA